MDAKPKPMMPEIKAEVLKTDDGKKKATGLLGGLFGSGGTGAAGGLGGLGAGAAGGGGLLATKAGMLALVIVGTSVAGGIGLAGYKMFGPSASDQTGGNLSLFAPKPAQVAEEPGAAAPADGNSQSLSLMAQSAAKDKAAEASASGADAAPTDNTAGSGAADATAAEAAAKSASASGGAINSGGGAGATGNMGGSLTGVKKLGALSGAGGSSGGSVGSASSAAGASGRLGDNMANAARNGASSAFSKGGAGAKSSSARGMAARGGRGARAQARAVMGDQARGRAGSSFAAGRTYDGSAANNGGAIGPDGSAISMGGAGDGGAAQPKAIGASKRGDVNEQEVPDPGEGKAIVTEWEKNIKKMMMLAALAAVLFYAASKVKATTFGTPWTDYIVKAMGVAIIAIGVAIGVIAGMVLNGVNGEPGQKMPGGIGIVASLLAIGAGVYTFMNPPGQAAADEKKAAELEASKKATIDQAAAESGSKLGSNVQSVEQTKIFTDGSSETIKVIRTPAAQPVPDALPDVSGTT